MSNTQTVLAFEETVYNKHEVREGFEHYVGPIYREHDPRIADGKEPAIRTLTQLVALFPGSRVTIRRTIAQGNLVAVQLLWMQQPEQSGGIVRVDIYRLENARIVEHWDVAQQMPATSANGNPAY
jgi:predicted SnoaL-like aldol condensation-catalyzing enzyme